MYPSSLRTLAISTFIFDAGISIEPYRFIKAFLILVSISAIGSVIAYLFYFKLPTRLSYTRNPSKACRLPEAQPAHAEFSQVSPWPPTKRTAVLVPRSEFGFCFQLLHH